MDLELKWAWRSRGNTNSMIETAKEELELLESQHPNSFHTLKEDLRAFIQSQNHNACPLMSASCPTTATQESSSCGRKRKRKKLSSVVGEKGGARRRKNTTDAVMRRAQQCLSKLQFLKSTLLL